jgi:hypothetical protein
MPASPSGPDLHIDAALTNVSVAYFQDTDKFIADKVFPAVPVDKRSDLYRKYSKSDWRRTDAQKRAPGTESAKIQWNVSQDNYYCEVYAASVDIDDQTRANADSNWDLDADATRLVTSHLLLQKDQLWASTYFKTGVWATEYTGVASGPTGSQFLHWDLASSDPLSNVTNWHIAFQLLTGFDFKFMVLGQDVWASLKNHPAILDRIKYTQKGVITKDLVASFFDVDKIYVPAASYTNVPQVNDAATQDAAATYSWILNSKSILLGYAPDRPSLLMPSAGYTFNWRGYGAGNKYGLTMSQFRQQNLRSDTVEGEAAYVQKIVSPDCGVFVNSAVA